MHTYLLLLHETPADSMEITPAQMQSIIQRHQAWAGDLAARGLLAGGEKLADDGGRRLRLQEGRVVATDGPYAEAHDVIGGFYLLKATDDAAAEALARECPHLEGRQWIELRRIDPDELTALLRQQRRRLVALLARGLGLAHLALAEDAVQTACLRALEHWPRSGWPDRPEAWLYRVAQRAALDLLRRDEPLQPWPEAHEPAAPAEEQRLAGELLDEELALLFAACHPALPPASQLLLALRSLGGFDLEQLAPLFFSTPAALAQRLARARALLAGESLAIPAGAELAPRREAVLSALALMFHQGQVAAGRSGGAGQGASALAPCWEAIRLARALAAHPACAAPQADALAALLLLHGARLSGRIDAHGDPVPLAGQPRERWDAGLIRLGYAHLAASQRGDRLTRWHCQAGIAAEHARAPTPEATDWGAILRYYEWLLPLDDSAAPRLGHAVALAEAGEPARALALLQALLPEVPAALRAHALAALARAAERGGEPAQAADWLRQAVAAAPHPADARGLQRRLQALQA